VKLSTTILRRNHLLPELHIAEARSHNGGHVVEVTLIRRGQQATYAITTAPASMPRPATASEGARAFADHQAPRDSDSPDPSATWLATP